MELRENSLRIQDYARLRTSVGWNNYGRVQTARALKQSFYTVTAVEEGRVIGMGRLVGDGLYLMVVDVVVHPNWQGQGVGRAMMEQLLDFAQRQTPMEGRISMQLIAEEGREPFYERLGFRRIPNKNCGSGMRQILYGPPPDEF